MSPVAKAAAEAVKIYEGYKNSIDCEEVKLFINQQLVGVKRQQNDLTQQLKKITDPLVNIRRDALSSKQAAENVFAPVLAHLATAERILKDEILRYEQVVERKRLQLEAESRRAAEEEQRRLEAEAQRVADEATRKAQEEQDRANELERQGKQAEADRVRLEANQQLELAGEEVERLSEDAQAVVGQAMVPSSSVKMAGTSITGKWVADVHDPVEVLAGIVDKSTSLEALRVKVGGKLMPAQSWAMNGAAGEIEGIEINLPWFQTKARELEERFSYRGMKARFEQGLRVRA